MYERFTDRARKVMQLANQEAQRFNHEYVGTEHVLLGLIKEGSGVAANVLRNLDVDLRKIRNEVEKIVQAGPEMVTMGKLPQTPRAKKVIEYAIEEARNLNHNYVGTEHLLLGLLREQEGVAAQVLMNLNLKLEEVREEVLNLLGHGMDAGGESERGATSKGNKSKTPALDSFGRDLTDLARQGKLDPVIGRQNEIERVIQVLSRRTKNNPVLLGEAGRRQDGDRRGPGPDDRRRQRARVVARPPDRRAGSRDDGRGHQVPRPVRRADQGRHERGPAGQEHDPLHRRAAHPGRRRRRRGGDRRLQRPQAGPGSRRGPVHRRHHARRVSQVHREGRGPGAAVPDDRRRAAQQDTRPWRSSAACATATRRTTASRSPTRRSRPPSSSRIATSPAAACPTRRSTSSTRPAPASGSRP